MKLLVVVLIIGSTGICVDCYDFKKGYFTNVVRSNPQYPDQDAQSAYEVHFGSPPNLAQQHQIHQNPNQYSQPSQAFNVGYSVSFTNGAPSKPKQPFPDIVLGSHKEQVMKPYYASYVQNQVPEFETKPSRTSSWPTLGSGMNMFHSTNTNLDPANTIEHTSNSLTLENENTPRSFDHAKALGGSQGFDYTDVLGVNPIHQFNRNYNQQIPEVLKTIQTLNYSPINNVPISTSSPVRNVVNLGNHPGTNIIISDNLKANLVPEGFMSVQKQTMPNQEAIETFTASPTTYEALNDKFNLNKSLFPLRYYQVPISDLTPTPSQYTQYYTKHEAQSPDFSYDFSPQPPNQVHKNYRTFETVYGQPHRYYRKYMDNGRIKHFNMKTKFARGIQTAVQPPNHRTLPRRKWVHNARQMN